MNKFKVPIKNALFMYSYIWDKACSEDLINIDANDNFKSSNIFAELYLIKNTVPSIIAISNIITKPLKRKLPIL